VEIRREKRKKKRETLVYKANGGKRDKTKNEEGVRTKMCLINSLLIVKARQTGIRNLFPHSH
jgi:hypothetical protein